MRCDVGAESDCEEKSYPGPALLSSTCPVSAPASPRPACRALEGWFPLKSAPHFLTKVALNQLVLAPLVLTVVFSWNLALQRQAGEIPAKMRRDFLPSLFNGEGRRGWGGSSLGGWGELSGTRARAESCEWSAAVAA